MTEHTKGLLYHYFYPTPRKHQKNAAINSIMLKGTEKEIVHWSGFDASHYPTKAKANARRFVACWNALDNIPTELLEAEFIKELVGAALLGNPVLIKKTLAKLGETDG